MGEGEWFPFAWAVMPVLAGVALVWWARRRPSVGSHPAITALLLFWVLVVVSALDTPGGDLVTPLLGMIVSLVVSVWTFAVLRRRLAPA